MNNLVSVIIPAYNSELFIGSCLDSILNGTYKNIEIIVVNDGSIDNTAKLCDEYAKKYLNIKIIHSENGGVSSARNKGIDAANGDYITFVDADDMLTEDAIEVLVNTCEKTNADITSAKSCRLNIDESLVKKYGSNNISIFTNSVEIIRKSVETLFQSVCAKLYRRELIGNTRFVVGKKINEDTFFNFECLLKCKSLAIVDDYIYAYVFNPASASQAPFSKKFYDIIYFRDEKVRLLKENFPKNPELATMMEFRCNLDFLNKMASSKSGYTKKELYSARKNVLNTQKGFVSKAKKEKVRMFLIKYAFPVYRKYMQRNS